MKDIPPPPPARKQGRPALFRSPAQKKKVAKRKMKGVYERRKEQYKTDPEYREEICEARRTHYRQEKQVVLPESCRKRLPEIESYGKERTVWVDRRKVTTITLSVEELATVIGTTRFRLYIWSKNGQFPKPSHALCEIGGRSTAKTQRVYTLEEARKLGEVMASHQEKFAYFRACHAETIEKLFAAAPEKS